jgi:predicted enzyme related to lactoylglutathione lyase
MSYILAENLELSLKEVQKNGATIKMGLTPVGDMGQFAIIIDPTGAHIAMWESKSEGSCC